MMEEPSDEVGDNGFRVEDVLPARESFESVSTENSEETADPGLGGNRAFAPCGVGATVQVRLRHPP